MIQSFTESFSATPSQRMYTDIISQAGGGELRSDGPGSFANYLKKLTDFSENGRGLENKNRESLSRSEQKNIKGMEREAVEKADIDGSEAEKNSQKVSHRDREAEIEKESSKKASSKNSHKNEGSDDKAQEAASKESTSSADEAVKKNNGKENKKQDNKDQDNKKSGASGQDGPKELAGLNVEVGKAGKNAAAASEKSEDKKNPENNSKKDNSKKIGENELLENLKKGLFGKEHVLSTEAATENAKANKTENGKKGSDSSSKGKEGDIGLVKKTKKKADVQKGEGKLTVVDLRSKESSKTEKRLFALRRGETKEGADAGEKAGGKSGLVRTEGSEAEGAKLKLREELLGSAQNGKTGGPSGGSDSSDDKFQMIRVDLPSQGGRSESSSFSGRSGNLENSLLRQMKAHLNGEIVKRGGIVVRDNGTGEIRLNLKPDHLGSVRIRLSLEDNHIAGKIYVENSSIREVFEQNLQDLQRAFKEQGYETTSLEVSVGDGKHQRKGEQKGGKGGASAQAIQSLEDHVPQVGNGWNTDQLVDLMV